MTCKILTKNLFLLVLGMACSCSFPAQLAAHEHRFSSVIQPSLSVGCISPRSWFTSAEPGGNGRAEYPVLFASGLRLVCFPFIQGAITMDRLLYFIGGRHYWGSQKMFRHIRKCAFRNSIVIIVDDPGQEIKFMDNRSADPKREFIGWGKMDPASPGSLDIHYQVKTHDAQTGKCRYLTRFTGDDILEYILDYFGKDIERIHSLFDKSNLEAFNIAYARKPGDVVYAFKNTHFGDFMINRKGWWVRAGEIIPEGEAGRMHPGILEPARAAFYNVEITVHPPMRFYRTRKIELWTPGQKGWEIGWNLSRVYSASA